MPAALPPASPHLRKLLVPWLCYRYLGDPLQVTSCLLEIFWWDEVGPKLADFKDLTSFCPQRFPLPHLGAVSSAQALCPTKPSDPVGQAARRPRPGCAKRGRACWHGGDPAVAVFLVADVMVPGLRKRRYSQEMVSGMLMKQERCVVVLLFLFFFFFPRSS